MMRYNQFIYGKTTGGRNYQLVAFTPDLAGREDELEAIARQYRFWGQQPPVANPIAVGVFHHQEMLLLVQAMPAALPNGQPALDIQGRAFTQHRYIFIPAASLNNLAGRLWVLVNWIMKETRGIPTFDHIERNLTPLNQPHYGRHWYNPEAELEKVTLALGLTDKEGQPVLLSVLAALANQKRVIFDAASTHNIFSEDLLECVLLLLPAFCRRQLSVAAGALDEKICTQATLMVKTNGSPSSPLSTDLIWAKRADNTFFGQVEPDLFKSNYTTLLAPIVTTAESRPILLKILDTLEGDETNYESPWQTLNNGWLTTRLIPAMPNAEERAKYWRSTLSNLSPVDWGSILPSVVDDTGLEIAWAQLQTQVKRDPATYAPLVFQLWKNFSQAYIGYALQQELPADLELAEGLMRHGLLTELDETHQQALHHLCLTLLTTIKTNNPAKATALVTFIEQTERFSGVEEQLSFKEALLPANAERQTLLNFFKAEMLTLLPTLAGIDLSQRPIYQALQQQAPTIATLWADIVARQGRAMDKLLDLAEAAELSLTERITLYTSCLTTWDLAWNRAKILLTDLVTHWIASYPPAERPHMATLFVGLTDWLKAKGPTDLIPLLTVKGSPFSFEDWQTLGLELFGNQRGQVSFLDHVTEGQPVTHMAQQWLILLANDVAAKANFEPSYTWHTLQNKGPAWLAEAIAQLLGWQETSLTALTPTLERLQSSLNLPQATLFSFLENLPRQSDGDLGMMLSAYLPQLATDKGDALENLPLWQMLNAQAPKVAQVYKTLAEGQKNPAVDKFNQFKLNGALSEAPEYAPAMAHWLQVCGKGNWLSGRLLEALVEGWLAHSDQVDPALLVGLLQADLTAKYSVTDWLALAQVCWLPDYQLLWPVSGQPSLNNRQRIQALNIAKDCLPHYTTPQQGEKLVRICQNLGLTKKELAELVSNFPAALCNFTLLQPYLYADGGIIKPDSHTHQKLLTLALQLNAGDGPTQTQLKTVLTNLLSEQLQKGPDLSLLVSWGTQTTNEGLYLKALGDAVLSLAPIHFGALVQHSHHLQRHGHTRLTATMVTALDAYWQSEKKKLTINN